MYLCIFQQIFVIVMIPMHLSNISIKSQELIVLIDQE